ILTFGAAIATLLNFFLHHFFRSRRDAFLKAKEIIALNTRLRVALEAAQMATFTIDVATGNIWRSEGHDQLFGHVENLPRWNRETFKGYIIPEDRDRVDAALQAVMGGANPSALEFRILRHGDQALRWLSVMVKLVPSDSRQAAEMVGGIRDITEQKQLEIERLSALEWQRTMLNASSYSIISTDANGIIQTFNRASTELFGYSAEEIEGKQTPVIFYREDEVRGRAQALTLELGRPVAPGLDAFTAKARAFLQADENEWTFVRKDGSQFPVSLSISVLHGPNGEISGYLGISSDLTEKRKVLQAMQQSNDRLLRVIESSGEGIWEREYGSSVNLQHKDDHAKKIFGFNDEEEFSYEKVVERILPDDRGPLNRAIKDHFDSNSTGFEAEFRMQNPGEQGPPRWIRARGKILQEADKTPRLVATVRDVTSEVGKRHEFTAALAAAQEAAQAKTEFLASMSHEIRTPLNGVIGMADLLMETELSEEQRNYARIVQQSGSSLLLLINDILDFSKIEAGKLDLEKVNFSLVNLVETQADVLLAKAREKNLSLVTYISPSLPREFLGDSGRLGQILLNLTSNAIKFSSRGGVSIHVDYHSEYQAGATQKVRFAVTDSGIGISAQAQKRLFQPFVQGDDSTARKYGGTGLGLSICKRLVELMGGTIGVSSVEGEGSTFWFDVTLEAPRGGIPIWPKGQLARYSRALVADGDPLAKETMLKYLRALGIETEETNSFVRAIKLTELAAKEGKGFDLVVFGAGTNIEGALFAASSIAMARDTAKPDFILLDEMRSRLKAGDARFTAILNKPIKQAVLFEA
ncbi:MAG: PAS domain S-box protein, partial [Proteobacteria bacterium]